MFQVCYFLVIVLRKYECKCMNFYTSMGATSFRKVGCTTFRHTFTRGNLSESYVMKFVILLSYTSSDVYEFNAFEILL